MPVTLVPVFRRADLALGFDTVWLWHAIAAHRAWQPVLDIAYAYLPVAIALTWIPEQDRAYRRAALIAGVTCFGFYVVFPAAGPGFYDWKTGVAYGWRNCMPSMHLTWAILAARYAQRQPLRCVLWGYVALLVVATIGLGQHYGIDLLAAVPYSLAVSWCAELDVSALLGRTPGRAQSPTLHFIPQPPYGKERRQG